MKTLLGTSANYHMILGEDGIEPSVEVILITTEPHYSADVTGQIVKSRVVEQLRFVASPKGLRGLVDSLNKLAEGAEEMLDGAIKGIEDALLNGDLKPNAKDKATP